MNNDTASRAAAMIIADDPNLDTYLTLSDDDRNALIGDYRDDFDFILTDELITAIRAILDA